MTLSVMHPDIFLQRVEFPVTDERAQLLILAGDALGEAAMAGSVIEVSQNRYTKVTSAALKFPDSAVADSFLSELGKLS